METQDIDAVGLLCPLPVLRARRRLAAMRPGELLRMRADDPAAIVDVPHFCAETGHTLVSTVSEGRTTVYLIRKGDGFACRMGSP